MYYKADMHVHSEYSNDSKTKIKDIINKCLKENINCLAIADHNTIEGSLKAKKFIKDKKIDDIKIIISAEIKTDVGDIIGYHLNEEIKPGKIENVLDNIKTQGGLVCVPHPYDKYHQRVGLGKYILQNYKNIDFLELNARSIFLFNRKTKKLADKINKPLLASSDAHMSYEVSKFYTYISDIEKLTIKSVKANVFMLHPFFPLVRTKFYKIAGV